jgi:hypothetical protein
MGMAHLIPPSGTVYPCGIKHSLLPEGRHLPRLVLNAAQRARCIPSYLPTVPTGTVIIIGAGKAIAEMTWVFEQHWAGEPRAWRYT